MAKPKTLMARVGLDTEEFETGLRKMDRELRKLGDMGKIASDALKLFGGAVAAATAATAGLAVRGAMLAATFDDLGQRLGLSAGAVAELSHAARLSGVELTDLEQGLTKLAKQGPLEQELAKLADRMAAMDSHTERARLAVEIFGERAGARLIPMLTGGAAGLNAMREEARKLGLTLTDFQNEQIQKVNDGFDRLKSASEGLSLQLAAALAPALTAVAETLSDEFGSALGDSREDVLGWGEDVGDVIAFTADAAMGAIKTISTGFRSVGGTLGAAGALTVALVKDGTTAAASVFNDWAADQSDMWSKLANDTNLHAFRDRLEEIRAQSAETASAAAAAEKAVAGAVAASADALAAITVPMRRESLDTINPADVEKPDLVQQIADAERSKIEARLEVIRDGFKTEAQIEAERFAEQMTFLQQAEDAQITFLYDSEAERSEAMNEIYALREQVEQEHQKRMTGIAQSEADKRAEAERRAMTLTVDSLISGLGAAFNAIASSNKKRFEQAKTFAKAEAALNAYRAIQQVWADEQLPFYAKIAATAVTALRTAANISAINSTQFGGGTTPSAAGTPTVNGAPAAAPPQQQRGPSIFVTLQGESQSTSAVRELLDRISDTVRDGGQLVLSPG